MSAPSPQAADDGSQHLVWALSGWWVALSMEHGRTWLIIFIRKTTRAWSS